MKILTGKDLEKSYSKKKVVDGVTIHIEKGELVGLAGPNGAGKTTTFYMISGFVSPDKGSILLDDEDITDLPVHLRARKGIVYLPQEPSIFRRLTVEENILSALELYNPKKVAMEKLEVILNTFHLSHLRKKKGGNLSGGERRRTEIARAFSVEPHFMLLDEPFTGIDPLMTSELTELLKTLKSKGVGLLISDHNIKEVLKICDRIYILYEGKVIFHGRPDEVVKNGKVRELYLGEDFELR
jgi:lipopolysaccharide export system ATP-binding protein